MIELIVSLYWKAKTEYTNDFKVRGTSNCCPCKVAILCRLLFIQVAQVLISLYLFQILQFFYYSDSLITMSSAGYLLEF